MSDAPLLAGDAASTARVLQDTYATQGNKAFGVCRTSLLAHVRDGNGHGAFLWEVLLVVWSDSNWPVAYLLLTVLDDLQSSIESILPSPSVRGHIRTHVIAAVTLQVPADAKVVTKAMALLDVDDIDTTALLAYGATLLERKEDFTSLLKCIEAFPTCPWPYEAILAAYTSANSWPIAEQMLKTIAIEAEKARYGWPNPVDQTAVAQATAANPIRHLQTVLVELAIVKDDLKRAHRYVNQFRLQDAFPDVENAIRFEALDKLCSQARWPMAIQYVGSNVTLQTRLLRQLIASGNLTLASDVRDKFGLDQIVIPDPATHIQRTTHLEMPRHVVTHWCETDDAAVSFEQCVDRCRQSGTCWLGLDAEWKPVFDKTTSRVASVLQVAVGPTDVFLIDLLALENSTTWFQALDRVLVDKAILKVGFGLDNDLQVLRETFPDKRPCFQRVQGIVELKDVLRRQDPTYQGKGLSSATSHVLGARLDKTQQLSNWNIRPLTPAQLKYAATDAWCLVRILEALHAANPTLLASMPKENAGTFENPSENDASVDERARTRRRACLAPLQDGDDHVTCWLEQETTLASSITVHPVDYVAPSHPSILLASSLCLVANGTTPHLVVLPQGMKLDLGLFASASGTPRRRIRLATGPECVRFFGYAPGTVSPVPHPTTDAHHPPCVWIDQTVMDVRSPVLVGGGPRHLLECDSATTLRRLCGGEAATVTRLSKATSVTESALDQTQLAFLSTGHLWRVTKWLRMRGVDIQLCDEADPSRLLEQAATERRIVLTTDRKLAQRRTHAACFLVSSDDPRQQFQEIITHFGLHADSDVVARHFVHPRCTRCNGESFRMIDKEAAAASTQHIGDDTLATISEYWQCDDCDKVFWTAWKRFQTMRFQDAAATDKAAPRATTTTTLTRRSIS
ncbi:Aste57867_13314 [Aphanomyces stellatus]|uniref:Aste57867_13314 protein n=1 Tax=Aphanomyces stellatus TaxID=120398 RepID=A0A485KYH7_9STRA|nr:hypothetical protein As57867_013265 [Aphanomyces stellatus]VFT90153.1 Aste57867_13314 [Aphanomyces stellatus]